MSAPTTADDSTLSAECIVGQKDGYNDLHGACTQTEDIPLPHGGGLLLQRRCGCTCHRYRAADVS
ncbi:hypothetical protein ABTY96_28460 [Streptomyces sp. NPDC096057]|uniref:hypothetical protein n=1 Tax=Streptomyces sp. NPDC096057 TaxID=3155543 RepID=UPI00331FA051